MVLVLSDDDSAAISAPVGVFDISYIMHVISSPRSPTHASCHAESPVAKQDVKTKKGDVTLEAALKRAQDAERKLQNLSKSETVQPRRAVNVLHKLN